MLPLCAAVAAVSIHGFAQASNISYRYEDALKNTVLVLSQNKGVNRSAFCDNGLKLYQYSAYGQRTTLSQEPRHRADPDSHREVMTIINNGFSYSNQLLDVSTGFMGFGNGYRSYDPVVGQFMQSDSLSVFDGQHTRNGFGFALANPLVYQDPSGHDSFRRFFHLNNEGAVVEDAEGLVEDAVGLVTDEALIDVLTLEFLESGSVFSEGSSSAGDLPNLAFPDSDGSSSAGDLPNIAHNETVWNIYVDDDRIPDDDLERVKPILATYFNFPIDQLKEEFSALFSDETHPIGHQDVPSSIAYMIFSGNNNSESEILGIMECPGCHEALGLRKGLETGNIEHFWGAM